MTDPRTATAAETDRFFREIVLCLGGIFASQECDDALVWQVTKSLDRIYQRSRARILEREGSSDNETPQRRIEPHPAVEDLLSRIGRGVP
jgi:hypothetical protein